MARDCGDRCRGFVVWETKEKLNAKRERIVLPRDGIGEQWVRKKKKKEGRSGWAQSPSDIAHEDLGSQGDAWEKGEGQ